MIEVPIVLVVVMGSAILALAIMLWSAKRLGDPKFVTRTPESIRDIEPSLAALVHSSLAEGNRVAILENGAFFDDLIAAIESAASSVHFETYLWKEGTLGRRLAAALAERARAGVPVRVTLDAVGARRIGKESERILEEAGVQLVWFHAGKLRWIGQINRRTHRKLAVIDGRIGFIGGHCVVDMWLGNADDQRKVRDLSARIEGPLVNQLQAAFSENWVAETGELLVGGDVFPSVPPAGSARGYIARISPATAPSAVKVLYFLAIHRAQRRIRIQNPYFLPDEEGLVALCEAARRGVDVQIMVPTTGASDAVYVQHAAHRNFERLLRGGIRLLEYDRALLHQKVITVDGLWCAIGSNNFDSRSFEINFEVAAAFFDADLAARFDGIFDSDRQHCIEHTLESWSRRAKWLKLRDAALYMFKEQL